MPDIDIDFVDRDQALKLFDHVAASRLENNKIVKHNTGVYLHDVPVDPFTGLCEIDYESAENLGFFKIDFLNAGVYKGIRDEGHLIHLMNTEPLWDLLEQDEFVDLLFHVNGHGSITGNDSASQTLPDWQRMVDDLERGLAKTRK